MYEMSTLAVFDSAVRARLVLVWVVTVDVRGIGVQLLLPTKTECVQPAACRTRASHHDPLDRSVQPMASESSLSPRFKIPNDPVQVTAGGLGLLGTLDESWHVRRLKSPRANVSVVHVDTEYE